MLRFWNDGAMCGMPALWMALLALLGVSLGIVGVVLGLIQSLGGARILGGIAAARWSGALASVAGASGPLALAFGYAAALLLVLRRRRRRRALAVLAPLGRWRSRTISRNR